MYVYLMFVKKLNKGFHEKNYPYLQINWLEG